MESTQLVDCTGRRRSPATLPGYHRGRPPRNKGRRYPPDPPTVEEIISGYLRGIDNAEIVHAVHEPPAPMISATNILKLAH